MRKHEGVQARMVPVYTKMMAEFKSNKEFTVADAVKKYDLSADTIRRWIKTAGLPPPPRPARTFEGTANALFALGNGVDLATAAASNGMSVAHLRQVARRRGLIPPAQPRAAVPKVKPPEAPKKPTIYMWVLGTQYTLGVPLLQRTPGNHGRYQ